MRGKHPITGMSVKRVFDTAMERGLVAIGSHLERAAELLAPVATGRLAGSITYAARGGRSGVRGGEAKPQDKVRMPRKKSEVWIGTNVEYAPHVEYGTNQMRKKSFGTVAQPFLRPALDNNRKEVTQILSRELSKAIRDGK